MEFVGVGERKNPGGIFGVNSCAGHNQDSSGGTVVKFGNHLGSVEGSRGESGCKNAAESESNDFFEGIERIGSEIESAVEGEVGPRGEVDQTATSVDVNRAV